MFDSQYASVWFTNLGFTGTQGTQGTTNTTTNKAAKKKVDWNSVNNIINSLLTQGQSVANILATLKGQGVMIEGGSVAELRANAELAAKQQRNDELLTIGLWVGGSITLIVILAMILKPSN